MKLKALIPNIFYADINVGIQLFVHCLGFRIAYDDLAGDEPFCVVERDGVKAYLIQSPEFAAKDRPELHLETDDIQQLYDAVKSSHPQLLHPNSPEVSLRPWGAKEFALLDASDVCIVVQEWP